MAPEKVGTGVNQCRGRKHHLGATQANNHGANLLAVFHSQMPLPLQSHQSGEQAQPPQFVKCPLLLSNHLTPLGNVSHMRHLTCHMQSSN